ncbi:hypothetical protein FQR65_LT01885 [Abscondita terminalis]|nr:hypothetical protein FQR65_LT01885 [Abscondita terminalis]
MDLICINPNFFKNPEKLPLDELHLNYPKITRVVKNDLALEEIDKMIKLSTINSDSYTCESTKRPALDKCWIDRKMYSNYHPYVLHLSAEQNNLFMKNKEFLNNLQFLNTCSFQQFWCYICYEPKVTSSIKEFLHNATPLHLVSHLPSSILSLHNEIHSCICKIYQRFLEFKVSDYEYIKEDTARSILQDKGLFNPDVVLMLCYIYNSNSSEFVLRIMDFCLKKQVAFLQKTNDLFKKIVDELDHFTQTSLHNHKIASFIEEKTFFLYEVASSLHEFLSSCKPAIDIAFYAELPYCITYVYQKVYAETNDLLDRDTNGHDWTTFKNVIKKWLGLGKFEFVNVFHVFVTYCLDRILNLRNDPAKQDEFVELYLGLISNSLDNDLFVLAYNKTYSIREQFETVLDCVPNFDVQQTEYLLKSLDSIISEFSNDTQPEINVVPTLTIAPESIDFKKYNSIFETLTQYLEKPANKKSTNLPKNVSIALEQYYELCKQFSNCDEPGLNKDDIDSSVRAVLDVLPHLKPDFVLECLKKMNYNVNEVITKILSNDLSTNVNKPSTSKIEKYQNANEMLNDKKEKDSIKQFVLKASYTVNFDDEYDDRYEMGNRFNDSDDESRIYRHLEGENENVDEETSSSGEEETAGPQRDTRSDFCTDPALMREMRAKKFQNSRRPPAPPPNKNGQQNDDKAKKFNSARPKHNRKGGAHWKRNKGMIPS